MATVAAVVLQLSYLSLSGPLQYLRDARLVYSNSQPGYRYYHAGSFAERIPHYFVAAMAVKRSSAGRTTSRGALGRRNTHSVTPMLSKWSSLP